MPPCAPLRPAVATQAGGGGAAPHFRCSPDRDVQATAAPAPRAPALRHLRQRAAGGGAAPPALPQRSGTLPGLSRNLWTLPQDLEAPNESSEEEQEAAAQRRGKAPAAGRRRRAPPSEDEEQSEGSEAEPPSRKRGRKQAAEEEEESDGEGSEEDSSSEGEEAAAAAAPARPARRQPRFVPPPPAEPRSRSDMLSLLFACPALIGEGRGGGAVGWRGLRVGACGCCCIPAPHSSPPLVCLACCHLPLTCLLSPTHLSDALLEPDGLRPVTLVARDAAHLAAALGARAADMADLWCQLARRVDPRLAASGASVALPQGGWVRG